MTVPASGPDRQLARFDARRVVTRWSARMTGLTGVLAGPGDTPADLDLRAPRWSPIWTAVARSATGTGPVALAAAWDGAAVVRIDLAEDGRELTLAEEPLPRAPNDHLRDVFEAALAMLSHERRSPLVRMAGRLTLVDHAIRRGAPEQRDAQLRGLADALEEQLVVTDAEVAAERHLIGTLSAATPRPDGVVAAEEFVAAVRTAAGAAPPLSTVSAASPPTYADGLHVVVPRPATELVEPCSRLLTHLGALGPSGPCRLVLPGLAAPVDDVLGDRGDGDGMDPARPGGPRGSALVRAWPAGDARAVGVAADSAALRRGGVRVVASGGGGVDSLRLDLPSATDPVTGYVAEVADALGAVLGPALDLVHRR